MQRRQFLQNLMIGTAAWLIPSWAIAMPAIKKDDKAQEQISKLALTQEEWRARLTPAQYRILREGASEAAHTSDLVKEKRKGLYLCAGCDLALFASDSKFDAGTGWPSFYKCLPGKLGTKADHKLPFARTAYYCIRCEGHQGYLYKDGPKPTGLRYSGNGTVLKFVQA